MVTNMTHLCHAIGCAKAVPLKMLFCLTHWRMVPRDWQKVIWREYRPGQEADKKPSAQYLLVQAMVVAMVAVGEGRWTQTQVEVHVKATCEHVWPYLDRAWVQALPDMQL